MISVFTDIRTKKSWAGDGNELKRGRDLQGPSSAACRWRPAIFLSAQRQLSCAVDARRRSACCGWVPTVVAFKRKATTVTGKRITDLQARANKRIWWASTVRRRGGQDWHQRGQRTAAGHGGGAAIAASTPTPAHPRRPTGRGVEYRGGSHARRCAVAGGGTAAGGTATSPPRALRRRGAARVRGPVRVRNFRTSAVGSAEASPCLAGIGGV
jgi:hypothetical protein